MTSMWRIISRWHIVELGTLSCLIVTRWHRRRSGQIWHQVWWWLFVLVGWRCARSSGPPACLRNLWCAILAMMESVSVVLTKHGRVSFYRSLPFTIPRKLNCPHLLFSDFCARLLDQIKSFLYCSLGKPPFGHFVHIQRQVHVGLFQLVPISSPCHSSWHIEILQEISCCF